MKEDLKVIARLYKEHIERLELAFFIAVRGRNLTTAPDAAIIAF
jgi:hypothetical protein